MATTLDRFADRKPGWETPLMIASHQNGIRTKALNPNYARYL
jgi:3-keto-5-aminohexanoate cleavage enzyme